MKCTLDIDPKSLPELMRLATGNVTFHKPVNGLVPYTTTTKPPNDRNVKRLPLTEVIMTHFTPAGRFKAETASKWAKSGGYAGNSVHASLLHLEKLGMVARAEGRGFWQFLRRHHESHIAPSDVHGHSA